ncbi:MAG: ABC transporter ATP-binding protein [Ruminococcaceae bacterium]|nr:ABC transporter ATP-binding protein [Oscillospiraceae bacterium]
MIKRFCAYYRPYLKIFTFDMLCALGVALCNLVYPKLTGEIIDNFIPNKQVKYILILAAVLVVLYFLKKLMNFFIQDYGHRMAAMMQADMRRDLFGHMQKLPFTFYDNNKTGALLSRIVGDLLDVSELAHHGPEDLFLSVVLLISSFVLMAQVNIWLTLIIFACIPFMLIFALHMRKKMSVEFKAMRAVNAEINASIENSLTGVRVTKAYVARDYENEKFGTVTDKYVKTRFRALSAMAQFHSTSTWLFDLLKLVVLVSGGLFCIYGKITAGDFAAFLIYANVFVDPINRLVNFVEQFQNGLSGFERFCGIMDTPAEKDTDGASPIKKVNGEIVFENVTFRYNDAKEILSNLSFTVAPGKTLALVGPSGGGKTTICNIIPRFYDIEDGRVLLDGKDIRDITLDSLRQNVGIVSQDVFLFDSTIRDNICYGSDDVTEEEMITAAKRANIHEYIMSLPDGYDTEVGERGVKLSGGQKQRVAIARVFLKNPPILILDEATSALDNATEQQISESLNELSVGRTTIVVAHRLSTVKKADEIIVMTDDGIKERGNHDELMQVGGIYKELYEYQFRV